MFSAEKEKKKVIGEKGGHGREGAHQNEIQLLCRCRSRVLQNVVKSDKPTYRVGVVSVLQHAAHS